jgi:hypothetical protein
MCVRSWKQSGESCRMAVSAPGHSSGQGGDLHTNPMGVQGCVQGHPPRVLKVCGVKSFGLTYFEEPSRKISSKLKRTHA